MIIDDKGQYEGYAKGKSDFSGYSKMSGSDHIRYAKRWDTAKKVVELIANNFVDTRTINYTWDDIKIRVRFDLM